MYFLCDYSTVNFARKLGSKDKKKRNLVNVKKAALIGGLGYGGLNGLALQHPRYNHLSAGEKIGGGLIAAGIGAGVGAGIAKTRNYFRNKNNKNR